MGKEKIYWQASISFSLSKQYFSSFLNSLQKTKFLSDWSKLKGFADEKINMAEKCRFVSQRVENVVENGGNAGYQHFFLFPHCFQKPSIQVGDR